MTRLLAWLVAAAALVAGGLGLAVALNQSLQEAGDNCRDWDRQVSRLDERPTVTAFVAVVDGYNIPSVAGTYVIGNCGARECRVKPGNCDQEITYTLDRSQAVVGWRLIRIEAPRLFVRAWRELALLDPASVRFYRGWKEVRPACQADFTNAQCRQMLTGAFVCWRRGTQYCRNGLLYGPGLGGVDSAGNLVTCSALAGDEIYPCYDEGRGDDWIQHATERDYSDDEET